MTHKRKVHHVSAFSVQKVQLLATSCCVCVYPKGSGTWWGAWWRNKWISCQMQGSTLVPCTPLCPIQVLPRRNPYIGGPTNILLPVEGWTTWHVAHWHTHPCPQAKITPQESFYDAAFVGTVTNPVHGEHSVMPIEHEIDENGTILLAHVMNSPAGVAKFISQCCCGPQNISYQERLRLWQGPGEIPSWHHIQ